MDLQPPDNLQLRISYMLNEINEEYFKTIIQRQEKFLDKSRDISQIFEMISNTGGDILRQYILDQEKHDEIIEIIKKLVDYSDEIFTVIRKRYNSAFPRKLIL